jgi:hypothetical protein
MNLPPDETRLAELLRQPPLPDDGFSARVAAVLPAPATSRSFRGVFITLGALAGGAIALTRIGSLGNLPGAVEQAFAPVAVELATPTLWLGLMAAAGSVAYALFAAGPRSTAQ